MADNPMYNSYGQAAAPGEDPSDPNRMGYQYPAPPSSYTPGATPQQPGSYYGTPAPNQWPPSAYGSPYPQQQQQQPYPQPPTNLAPTPQFAYNAGPQAPMGAPAADPAMGGLTSQMSGLGIMGDGGAARQKKKHRHAHHDIGGAAAAPAPQAADAMQPGAQFLNTGLNQAPRPISPAVAPQAMGTAPGMVPQPGIPGVASGAGSVSAQGKVDPEAIPSVPRSRDIPAQYYYNHVYPTMEWHLPPPAAIPFVAHDQGNSSPKYARLTLNNIPTTSDFLSSTALPLGMILQPLARLDPGEQPIPVLDFGDIGPPRCRRCRAYINPFMTFRAGGNKFVCNMCTFPNDVPPEYFAPVDPSGVRVDRFQRPELMMGTVEFLVPKEYWNKEPVGLQQLFLIDISQESINRGFLKGVCRGILEALYGGDDQEGSEDETPRRIPEGSKIGIVTFDREVQFYNLSVCVLSSYGWEMANNADSGTTRPSANDGHDRRGRSFCSSK